MTTRLVIVGAALAAAMTLAAFASSAPEATSKPAVAPTMPADRYRVLLQRDIFLRDRSAGREGPRPPQPTAPVATDETSLVLTGLVCQGREWVAFFEDRRNGQVVRVAPGQAIGPGQLAVISLDAVEYVRDGQTRSIAIGRNLAGDEAAFSDTGPVQAAGLAPTSAPAGAASAATNGGAPAGGAGDVLERMRQRRAQELQR
jgi:hypothetical protein